MSGLWMDFQLYLPGPAGNVTMAPRVELSRALASGGLWLRLVTGDEVLSVELSREQAHKLSDLLELQAREMAHEAQQRELQGGSWTDDFVKYAGFADQTSSAEPGRYGDPGTGASASVGQLKKGFE